VPYVEIFVQVSSMTTLLISYLTHPVAYLVKNQVYWPSHNYIYQAASITG